jgi:predicted regulator of Ras-like GTPase activity (Roadblock/LC7/MglB family)
MVDRIEGCVAGTILGVDGILIERYLHQTAPPMDLDLVATEFTTLLRRSMRTAEDTGLDQLREMMFVTDSMTFLLRPITSEYFILLVLNWTGNVGRARFELRKAQLALETEFAI